MAKIHVWKENKGWVWDDAENHGGFDACVPSGPFNTSADAIKDASDIFDIDDLDVDVIFDELPAHYPEK